MLSTLSIRLKLVVVSSNSIETAITTAACDVSVYKVGVRRGRRKKHATLPPPIFVEVALRRNPCSGLYIVGMLSTGYVAF